MNLYRKRRIIRRINNYGNYKKPKQNRAINTFESIVSAGFISVMKNGLDHTTVLKVCEIAGVGSGSFYEYFKNKKHFC